MADQTPEQLKKQIEELNKKIKDAGGLGIDFAEAMTKANSETEKLNKILDQLNTQYDSIVDSADYIFRVFQDISAELRKQNVLYSISKKAFGEFKDLSQDISNYQKGITELSDKQFKKTQQNLAEQTKELLFVQSRLELSEQSRLNEISRIQLSETLSAGEKKRLTYLLQQQALLVNARDALKSGIPILQNELNLAKQINDTRKDLGGISQGAIKLISQFGGSLASSLNISSATEALEEYNKKLIQGALNSNTIRDQLLENEKERQKILEQIENKEGNIEELQKRINELNAKDLKIRQDAVKSVNTLSNKLKGLEILTKELGEGLLKAFTDPVTMITTLIKLGFKADEQVTQLGKSLGISKDAAGEMRSEMATFARESGDAFINTDRLAKAQAELSQELGIAVKFSNEELATFSKLTELTGLTAQEAGKLAQLSAASGMSTEAYTGNIREGAFAAMQATKTHFSQKEIMQDISKLSAGILVKFRGNPTAIAAAVVEAKKFGLTLEQIDKVGESLLNFEESIENELKAELITGKQLNLERARYAALTGNQLELSREIADQVGSLADYEKMNVIQQKSLAQAFGMSREEMSEMLIKQEAIRDYGQEAAQLNKEQLEDMKRQGLSAKEYLAKQEQQRTAQAKFQDAMVKLQGIIANLVDGPIGKLLDILASAVESVVNLTKHWYVFYPLVGLVALSFLPKMLGGFNGIAKSIGGIFSGAKAGFQGLMGGLSGLKKGITSAFSPEGGGGVKGFFKSIKEGFKGTQSQFAGGSFSKGKELLAKKQAAEAAAKGVEGAAEKGGKGLGGFAKGINTSDMVKAAAAILILSGALFVAAKAFQQFADVKWEDMAKAGVALTGLSLVAMALGKAKGAILEGALAIGVLGIALIPLAYALNLAAPAIEAFGNVVTAVFEGMATVITAAANGISTIFISLQNVDVMKLLAIGPALFGIGAGLAALGGGGALGAVGGFFTKLLGGEGPVEILEKLSSYGDSLKVTSDSLASLTQSFAQLNVLEIDEGKISSLSKLISILGKAAIPIAFLSTALIPFIAILKENISIVERLGTVVEKVFQKISDTAKVILTGITEVFDILLKADVNQLLAIGPALISVGTGLAALGTGGLIGGLASGIGKLFGEGPIETLSKLSALGEPLKIAADSIRSIAEALTQVSTALAGIDTTKLQELDEFASNRAEEESGGILGGITKLITAPIKAVGEAIGGSTVTGGKKTESISPNIDLTPMIAAINEVKASVDKLYTKNSTINMDGEKVGYITNTKSTQNSYKFA